MWKQIEDLPYEVSDIGEVRRIGKQRLMKLTLQKHGYLQLGLMVAGKQRMFLVHRLVAQAFITNSENLPQVNHKDEVKDNNAYSNLEWCDNQYNCEYTHAKHYTFKSPTDDTVELFNLHKFCRNHNLTTSKMCEVANGKRKQHKGWTL